MKCPFPGCQRVRQDGQFCCYTHWVRMDRESQSRAMVAMRSFAAGTINDREFNKLSDKIVLANWAVIDCERLPGDKG